jgi:hypothetical protein
MEIKIKASPKSIEVTNYLISQAIKALSGNEEKLKAFKLTEKDLVNAEKFRKQLIAAYLK